MAGPPAGEKARAQARAACEDAAVLCARAQLARARSEALSGALVDTLVRVGARGDAFSLRLGRQPSAVRLVRHSLRRWLANDGLDRRQLSDIELACSEACANAVEHPVLAATNAFVVEATRTPDAVTLSVHDYGGWRPGSGGEYTRGRGLGIIRQLMDETEVVTSDEGTTLVMRLARSHG